MMRHVCLILVSLCLHIRVADSQGLSLADRIKGINMRSEVNTAPVVQNNAAETMQVVISVPEAKVVKNRKHTTKSTKIPTSAPATSPTVTKKKDTAPTATDGKGGKGDSSKIKKSTTKSDKNDHKKITLPPTPPPTPLPTMAPVSACSKGSRKSSSRRYLGSKSGKGGGKGGSKGSKKCSSKGGKGSSKGMTGSSPNVFSPIPAVPFIPVSIPTFSTTNTGTGTQKLSKKGIIASNRDPNQIVAPVTPPSPIFIGVPVGVPGTTPTAKGAKRRRLY